MPRRLCGAFVASLIVSTAFGANVRVERLDGTDSGAQPDEPAPAARNASPSGPRSGPVRVRPVEPQRSGQRGEAPGAFRSGPSGRTRVIRRSDSVAPSGHSSIAGNTRVIRTIERQRRAEVEPNKYYWHRVNGHRYCHYYSRGTHWYGFYDGPSFYWTRYHGNRWWWYEQRHGRWVYWANGHWWWPAAGGVSLVFVRNAYYPPDEAPVSVEPPDDPAVPVQAPEKTRADSWDSPDGTRMVQVFGPRSEAFLYDKTVQPAAFMGFLGHDVAKVRFAGGKDGKPLKVLVDFNDGGFALFSGDGKKLEGEERTP